MNEERNGTIGVDNVLYRLYQEATGYAPESMMLLPGAGSGRKYYRMRGVESLIGVVGTDVSENRAFVELSRHFRVKGLPVPVLRHCSDLSLPDVLRAYGVMSNVMCCGAL